jgi:hypothetical protein
VDRRAVFPIMSGANQAYWTYSLNIFFKYLEYIQICSIYSNISLSGGCGGLSGEAGGRMSAQTNLESSGTENDGNNMQSSLPMKTWNYGMRSLNTPACSLAKELTFAKISIDGSLPPTPIK